MSQVQEFQLIFYDINDKGMLLSESFQVVTIIEKLLPSWKDFKNYVKHKHKKIKVEDIIMRLRIKKNNKLFEKEPALPFSFDIWPNEPFFYIKKFQKKLRIFVDLFIGPLHFCFVLF
jgi:hypothetical protein